MIGKKPIMMQPLLWKIGRDRLFMKLVFLQKLKSHDIFVKGRKT